MSKYTDNQHRLPSLAELKMEVREEVGKSVALFFAPIAGVFDSVSRTISEVNQRAQTHSNRYKVEEDR